MSFPVPVPVIGEFSINPPSDGELMRRTLNAVATMASVYGENALINGQPICATGTTPALIKTTAVTGVYRNKGIPRASKGATDPLWTKAMLDAAWLAVSPSSTSVPVGTFEKFLLCIDAAGTGSVVACTPSTVSLAAVTLPQGGVPDGLTVLGVFSVSCTSAAYDPGDTTTASGGGITTAFADGFDTALAVAPLVRILERPGT
jgi:hypothetical protein